MVNVTVKDINDNMIVLKDPVRLTVIRDIDAPAGGLEAEFYIKDTIPELKYISVIRNSENVFSGNIDEQSIVKTSEGCRLIIRARSIEALLLDNEAMPQTYHLPSFGIIFERHFRPLGFKGFKGSDKSFNGELVISKGMSQWAVLFAFCDQFIGCRPFIDPEGIIDISGDHREMSFFIGQKIIRRIRTVYRRHSVISDITARTYPAGGYKMNIKSNIAEKLEIKRKRYLNTVGTNIMGINAVRDMITRSDRSYKQTEIVCSGFINCRPDDTFTMEGSQETYRITEVIYSIKNGEDTIKVISEEENNVAQ